MPTFFVVGLSIGGARSGLWIRFWWVDSAGWVWLWWAWLGGGFCCDGLGCGGFCWDGLGWAVGSVVVDSVVGAMLHACVSMLPKEIGLHLVAFDQIKLEANNLPLTPSPSPRRGEGSQGE